MHVARGLNIDSTQKERAVNANQKPHEEQDKDQDKVDKIKRHPSEADDEQLDEALEETFPASDPISP